MVHTEPNLLKLYIMSLPSIHRIPSFNLLARFSKKKPLKNRGVVPKIIDAEFEVINSPANPLPLVGYSRGDILDISV